MSDCDYRRQVSPQHLEILAQYMERYPLLALSNTRSREDKLVCWRLWDKIGRTLNKIDGRVVKNGRNWSRYWADLKFKTRRKYSLIQSAKADGRQSTVKLTQWERRIVKILTDDEGKLLPNAHQQTSLNSEPTQLKTKQKPEDSDNDCQHLETSPELINISESEQTYKHEPVDPIRLTEDYQTKKNDQEDTEKKTLEDLKRDIYEFHIKRQKELFEMEKEERRERHKIEMDILKLRKAILLAEIKRKT